MSETGDDWFLIKGYKGKHRLSMMVIVPKKNREKKLEQYMKDLSERWEGLDNMSYELYRRR